MTLKSLGSKIRRLINREDVFELLRDGDWGAGGCWMLAEAIQQFLDSPAELYAVVGKSGMVQHILVRYDDAYIDYNGTQTIEQLDRNIANDPTYTDGPFRLKKLTKKLRLRTLREGYIPLDQSVVRSLVSVFQRELP